LVAGELALNTLDEKLYFKNSAGTVKLLASNAGAFGSVTSVAASVPAFLSIAGSPITTSGTLAITYSGTALPVANGGTGITTTPTNGQIPIGNGTNYVAATITAGTGITVTNASGSITIASSGSVSAATPTALGTVYGNTDAPGSNRTTLGYNAGLVNAGARTVFIGNDSGKKNTSGAENTAVGDSSLFNVVTGANNSAFGYGALYNNTASSNSAFGHGAAYSITTGDSNVAFGRLSLYSNTTGASNVSVGYQSLYSGTTSDSNVAVGFASLYSYTGNNTVAVGYQALRALTSGTSNTGVGHNVMRLTSTGYNNSAFGSSALYTNDTGLYNVAIGDGALYAVTASQNTALGSNAAGALVSGSNNTVIGYNAAASTTSVSNEITLGNSSVTAFRIPGLSLTWNTSTGLNSLGVGTPASGTTGEIRATNNITAYYSDDRLKKRLGSVENALDKVRTLDSFYYEANETAQELGYEPIREVGISAQQVQAVLPEVVVPAPIDDKYLTVRYERLVPLLIAAIKELDAKVKVLEAK
jgi:hypothetical protein